ncbi:MAG TPA: 6-phosphogluconolactonase [Candidatus Krumholzibacterium sp.]|nr:6-phosphogluconolactonase [Candidatus Krumholzibacterium sp.]
MVSHLRPDVRIGEDIEKLSRAAAAAIHEEIGAAVARGRCDLALAGGKTPRLLYSFLATSLKGSGLAGSIDIFWSDERFVPRSDPASNYRMALETLIEPAGIDRSRVHPVPVGEGGPQQAAEAYERLLREHFFGPGAKTGVPAFDIVILGIGADGHTASLFPGDADPRDDSRQELVIATKAPSAGGPADRISFNYGLIMAARSVHLIATGGAKRDVIAILAADAGSGDPARGIPPLPAASIISERATVLWVDREAAGAL